MIQTNSTGFSGKHMYQWLACFYAKQAYFFIEIDKQTNINFKKYFKKNLLSFKDYTKIMKQLKFFITHINSTQCTKHK